MFKKNSQHCAEKSSTNLTDIFQIRNSFPHFFHQLKGPKADRYDFPSNDVFLSEVILTGWRMSVPLFGKDNTHILVSKIYSSPRSQSLLGSEINVLCE